MKMKKTILTMLKRAIEETVVKGENQASAWGVYEPKRTEEIEKEIERYMKQHDRKNNK